MPGPNEPGYNVLHPPGTRAQKAWSNLTRSLTYYNLNRYKRTSRAIRQIRRVR